MPPVSGPQCADLVNFFWKAGCARLPSYPPAGMHHEKGAVFLMPSKKAELQKLIANPFRSDHVKRMQLICKQPEIRNEDARRGGIKKNSVTTIFADIIVSALRSRETFGRVGSFNALTKRQGEFCYSRICFETLSTKEPPLFFGFSQKVQHFSFIFEKITRTIFLRFSWNSDF